MTSAVLTSAVLALGVALPGAARAQSAINPVQTTTFTLSTNPTIFGGGTNINVNGGDAVQQLFPTAFDVTIQAGAVISTTGSGNGIIFGGGSVTNQAGGSVSGADIGVAAVGATAVSNAGTIAGGSSSDGVFLDAGGSVLNEATGLISGGRDGVLIAGSGDTVTNAGRISGFLGNGVTLSSGSVTNAVGGEIRGNARGVFISGAGTVSNAGSIFGGDEGIAILGGGSVINGATGTIHGGDTGVVISGSSNSVINAGSITASLSDAVRLTGGGSVTNAATGILFGEGSGVVVDSGEGTVTNAGRISGLINGVSLSAGGSVTNAAGGEISGDVQGVRMFGAGTVSNAGSIVGGDEGIALFGGGSVINDATGTIRSEDRAVLIFGSNSVINAGSITANGSEAVLLIGGGSVTNGAGGVITGFTEGVVIVDGVGAVTNAGTIAGTGGSSRGIFLFAGGSVTNGAGGVISGYADGVVIDGGVGTVTNAGTIAGTGGSSIGIDLSAGGSVTNLAGGTISGGVNAIFISGGLGAVSNAGTITGAVSLLSGGSVTNEVGGVINGAVGLIGSATVSNAGSITASATDGGIGVLLLGGGSVVNRAGGTITGSNIGVDISDPGAVTNAGTITGTGGIAVRFTGSGANTLILQTGSVLNGDAVGSTAGGATNALVLQGAGSADNAFLNFNTLAVQAAGLWALNGASTVGSATIESGTLVVGDAGHTGAALTGNVTVNAGGALAGAGTVIGDVGVLGGGAIAPGAAGSFTTLNVTGNVTFGGGSLYKVNLGAQGDQLVLSGAAALSGGTVQTSYVGPLKHSYNILHADGGLGGTSFTGVTSNWGGLAQSLTYTPTDVILTVTAAQLGAGIGLNGNQQNVADSINKVFNAGTDLPAGFAALFALDGNRLGPALNQLSGEATTGGQQGAVQMMTGFLGLMNDPSTDRGGVGPGGGALGFAPERAAVPGDARQAFASALKAPPMLAPTSATRWNVWASGFGGGSKINGDAAVGSSDVSARAYGVAAGADYRISPDTLIGFALSGGGSNWNLAQGLGGGTSHAFQAGIYGKTYFGPAYLSASLAAANHWMSTNRVAFGGDRLNADFNAQSFGGRIEGGYRFVTAFAGITPYAAAQVQLFRTPGYSESDPGGSGFGLSFAARDATAARSEIGSRFDRDFALVDSNAVMTLRGRLAWAHDWNSDPTLAATFQALPGANFIVTGATPATDSALASVGTELRWRSGWSLAVKLDGEFASQAETYTGTGTLRYQW